MEDVPSYSWDNFVSPLPSNSFSATEYAENFTSVPSKGSRSPSWATTSPANSRAPSRIGINPSHTRLHPPVPSEIDYNALSEHIPALYSAFEHSIDATQALAEVIELVIQGTRPSDSIINRLVLHDVDEYRCAVSTCERHGKGNGWARLDRARGHFRTEHLGTHFPCRAPATFGAGVYQTLGNIKSLMENAPQESIVATARGLMQNAVILIVTLNMDTTCGLPAVSAGQHDADLGPSYLCLRDVCETNSTRNSLM